MPSEFVESGRYPAAERTERRKSKWLCRSLWRGWVTRHKGDADTTLIELEIGSQIVVGNRPILTDSVEGEGAKVFRSVSRDMCRPMKRGSSYSTADHRLDRGEAVIYGRVIGSSANIGIWMKRPSTASLPIRI